MPRAKSSSGIMHLYEDNHSRGNCSVWYFVEINEKLESREISFTYKLFFSYPIVLKFDIEGASDTAVRRATFSNRFGDGNRYHRLMGYDENKMSLRLVSRNILYCNNPMCRSSHIHNNIIVVMVPGVATVPSQMT